MKKIICLFAVMVAVLSACNLDNKTYKVTVVKNTGTDNLLGGNKAMVVTESGDSIEVFISEGLLFNNRLPFSATMKKNEIGRYGYITDSVSSNTFDVTVTQRIGTDNLLGGEKVIVITKSGMSVECFISEEALLKNKIPFSATMSKKEMGRYGFIK